MVTGSGTGSAIGEAEIAATNKAIALMRSIAAICERAKEVRDLLQSGVKAFGGAVGHASPII